MRRQGALDGGVTPYMCIMAGNYSAIISLIQQEMI